MGIRLSRGWATFHYGRWRFDDYYGWEWIPGNKWVSAWVSWRHGGGYHGWAPLLHGISIAVSIGNGYRVPDNYWVYTREAYITSPTVYNDYAPRSRSVTLIRNATIIKNTCVNQNQTYVAGPQPKEILQVTHQNVRVYAIYNVNRPSNGGLNNNGINIYRPEVYRAPDARQGRVVDAMAYKQQYPTQAIVNKGQVGALRFNYINASKLAAIAKTETPDNKIVRSYPKGERPAVNQQQQPGQQPAPQRQ